MIKTKSVSMPTPGAVVNRHEWRRAILAAPTDILPAGTKVAGFALGEFVDASTGEAFPTYATIAKTCEMTERGVRSAVDRLVKAGFLSVRKAGFGTSNRATIRLPSTDQTVTAVTYSEMDDANRSPPRQIVGDNASPPRLIEASNTSPPRPHIGHRGDAVSVAAVTANLSLNQNYNPSLPDPREQPREPAIVRSRREIAERTARLSAERAAGRPHSEDAPDVISPTPATFRRLG